MVVFGAVTSIVHTLAAGVPSTFPARSLARTSNVWFPAVRLEKAMGLVQVANAAPSIRHSNVLPVSVDVNVKLAVVWFVGVGGPTLVIVVSGGEPSTFTEGSPVDPNGC
jgi:hypothetical protein